MKKISQIAALLLIAAASSSSYAGNRCDNNCPDCDLSGCVSWDFTDTGPDSGIDYGDPLEIAPTVTNALPGQGPDKLLVSGWAVGVYGNPDTGTGGSHDEGVNYDASSVVATDDGGNYNKGLGVDSTGAPSSPSKNDAAYGNTYKKWIDNIANEGYGIRDALVLQPVTDAGEACLVSVEHLGIESHDLRRGSDQPVAEFELWAYLNQGADLADILAIDYKDWTGSNGFEEISLQGEFCCDGDTELVYTPTEEVEAEFFFLVMNHPDKDNKAYYDAKIRLTSFGVTCEDCGGDVPQQVPAPGTLALLGIGVIASRRYWLKAR